MKHVKLFEQFAETLNEGLKKGRDEALAKGMLAYWYAPEGSGREQALFDMGLNPVRYDSNPDNIVYFSGWGKDAIKRLSGARRVPSNVMMGEVVTLAAGNGNTYYFDGVDFVENSKTIIGNAMEMTMTEFIDKLIKLKVIETPSYK